MEIKRSRSDYHLPEEIVEQILLRVRSKKSIIRCGCVCKSWYSLIKTRNFIITHLNKTRKTLIFMHNVVADHGKGGQLSCIIYDESNPNYPFDESDCRVLRLPTNTDDNDPSLQFHIVGSYNGVVCLYELYYLSTSLFELHYPSIFILCNPSIYRSISVPMPPPQHVSVFSPDRQLLGFGFDDKNHDYKIVTIFKTGTKELNYWTGEIYSLNSNSWKVIDDIPNNFKFLKNSVIGGFVNGRLHWVVRRHTNDQNIHTTYNSILAFDLTHESFHYITLPNCLAILDPPNVKVSPLIKSALVVSQYDLHIGWTMKEYGAEESWEISTHFQLCDNLFNASAIINMDNFMKLRKLFKASTFKYVPSLELLDKQNS